MSVPIVDMQPAPSIGYTLGAAAGTGLSKLVETHRAEKESKRAWGGLAPLFEEMGVAPQTAEALRQSGIPPEEAVKLLGHVQKGASAMKEEGQLRQIGQESFDRMVDILGKGNLGLTSGIRGMVGEQTAEDIGEFESAAGALESMLVDMVSRGTLSNARFKYITETLLPKAGDRESKIRGKLKALAPMLGLSSEKLLQSTSKNTDKPRAKVSSEGTVRMKDPSTGKTYQVPRDKVAKFKSQGAELVQ